MYVLLLLFVVAFFLLFHFLAKPLEIICYVVNIQYTGSGKHKSISYLPSEYGHEYFRPSV